MPLILEQVNIDARDPVGLARWWATALGWVDVTDPADTAGADDPDDLCEIRPAANQLPGLLFIRVPEGKSVKNRLHLDFRPTDQAAEVARLLEMGARRADVGQGDASWVVLQDPEGNEFCVLSGRG